jgi:uncharacterized protein (TIRG00374 family)
MLKSRLINLAKYAVSIGIIVAILWEADKQDLLSAFSNVSVSLFGMALLMQTLNIVIRGYKWQLLLKAQGTNMPLGAAIRLTLMSVFFNNFFLGSIGGDVFRVYKASDYSESRSRGDAASSVIMDRFSGFFAVILMVLVMGTIYLLLPDSLISNYTLLALPLLALAVIVGTLITIRFSSRILSLPLVRRIPKVAGFTNAVIASFWAYRHKPGVLTSALLFSVLFQISRGITLYFLVLATSEYMSLSTAVFIELLISIVLMIPISIHGIGVMEGSYVLYLNPLGIEISTALLIAILMRATAVILSLVGGLLYLVGSDKQVPAHRSGTRIPLVKKQLQ